MSMWRRNGERSCKYPILLGLGIDGAAFSMNTLVIPMIKKFIRSVSMEECKD